jgi:hypothetical protein
MHPRILAPIPARKIKIITYVEGNLLPAARYAPAKRSGTLNTVCSTFVKFSIE